MTPGEFTGMVFTASYVRVGLTPERQERLRGELRRPARAARPRRAMSRSRCRIGSTCGLHEGAPDDDGEPRPPRAGRALRPRTYEPRWRERWAADDLYRADDADPRQKYYPLTMYPYPSGDLHIGHWYAATGPDIVARMRRMQGLQRDVPDGLRRLRPAGRERGHRARHPPDGVDRTPTSIGCGPSSGRWAHVRLEPRGGHLRPGATTAGRSGSSSSSSSTAWPTRPWRRWTGARRTMTLAREQVWARTATASAATRRSSSATWSSGSSASRNYADELLDFSRSTGRSRSASCRPTGSAAARAPRSTSRLEAEGVDADPRLHHPPRHDLRGDLHGARPGASARSRS